VNRLIVSTLRRLLRVVVRFETMPAEAQQMTLDRQQPVCYALQVRQLSAFLLLEEATSRLGLPRASVPLIAGALREKSAFFFLTRSGQPSPLQRNPYEYSKRLERIVAAVREDPSLDVQVVPVSIFWGRAPVNQDSILKALFADSWVTPGVAKQMVRLLLHGRQTLLKFGEPISVREAIQRAPAEGADGRTAVRRVARLLRTEFRRERELAVGPNLSHRQTLMNVLVDSPPVREAIREEAARRRIGEDRAELAARRLAYEIASDYSYPFIRAYDIGLTALWNRIYNGVEVHRFDDVAQAGAGAEIVYVPCHRSHIDYLLLSYVIFHRGLLPPHIAAGINLNFPLVGAVLRRGGAFFLRRSFRGDPLYAAVFAEYLHTIMRRGFPIEYFVEGGRSRTGRTLPPKTGLLGMTVGSYLRDPHRPVVFVPVWIGYEQLIEGDSFVAELSGEAKRKESLLGLVRSLRDLRARRFGRVHVNIGEPIRLDALLDEHWPQWRTDGARAPAQAAPEGAQREALEQRAVSALALRIVTRINEALVVNPVNLLAVAMLGSPRQAMDAARLTGQIEMLRGLLAEVPYSARQTVTDMDGQAVIAYAHEHAMVRVISHPLGDIVQAPPRQAALLAYFRNNVLHAFALPALAACLVSRSQRIEVSRVRSVASLLLPFLRAELFLSMRDDELDDRLQRTLRFFAERGMLLRDGDMLQAPAPTQQGSQSLHALAQVVRQPLERYFIAVGTLVRFGSGSLSAASLEQVCQLFAQRVAFLYESGVAPDFTDRAAFRSIVRTLLEVGTVTERDGRLHFGEALQDSALDPNLLLPEDVVLAISHAAQLSPEDLARAARLPDQK
jgi:glycerol-3-phosphate O-acyltransferase